METKYHLVTGAAGFIGYHTCKRLIKEKKNIIGIDNINNYYDVNLKKSRLENLNELSKSYLGKWIFIKCELENELQIKKIFDDYKPEIVIHLAAQAGVRYSFINPKSYIYSNLVGFYNIIEASKNINVKNFLYASSSSVYGGNKKIPFSEADSTNHPVSLYAATKRSNELMAHTYSDLYNIPTTGLRFFTVYGPWGRPDMAPMIFTKAILSKEPIQIFNHGEMSRSFTYIKDIIEIIIKLINKPAIPDIKFDRSNPNPATSWSAHRIYNIGNENPVKLLDFIKLIEDELGIKSVKEFKEMQPGDVQHTFSDCTSIRDWIGDTYQTPLKEGIKDFINWYKEFYKY